MKLARQDTGNVKYDSPLREKGSTTFFLIPFLPLDRRLFYTVEELYIPSLMQANRYILFLQPYWIRALAVGRRPLVVMSRHLDELQSLGVSVIEFGFVVLPEMVA